MGLPMLRAMIASRFDARGLDIREVGDSRVGTDAAAFAFGLRTLLTVVRDAAETEALLFGGQALVARAKALDSLILCSTLSPKYVTDLATRLPARITLIDAPMSGAQVAAREARLSFMFGGDAARIDRLMPLFRAMGNSFHHMGGIGAGMAAKVLNNLVAAASVAATRTALDWAGPLGLDGEKLRGLMHASSGQTWFGSHFDAIEFARDGHADDNTIGILVKDVACALDAAPDDADATLAQAIADAIAVLKPYAGP